MSGLTHLQNLAVKQRQHTRSSKERDGQQTNTSTRTFSACFRIHGYVSRLYLVVEEANLEDVLHVGRAVRHAEVSQRVAHQDDVAVFLELLEVLCVPQGAVVFVVHVDQLAFKTLQDAL